MQNIYDTISNPGPPQTTMTSDSSHRSGNRRASEPRVTSGLRYTENAYPTYGSFFVDGDARTHDLSQPEGFAVYLAYQEQQSFLESEPAESDSQNATLGNGGGGSSTTNTNSNNNDNNASTQADLEQLPRLRRMGNRSIQSYLAEQRQDQTEQRERQHPPHSSGELTRPSHSPNFSPPHSPNVPRSPDVELPSEALTTSSSPHERPFPHSYGFYPPRSLSERQLPVNNSFSGSDLPSHHTLPRRESFAEVAAEVMRRRTDHIANGLGDRERSPSSSGGEDVHHWDTLLSNITPDPSLPSAGSSFASASAAASFQQHQNTDVPAHMGVNDDNETPQSRARMRNRRRELRARHFEHRAELQRREARDIYAEFDRLEARDRRAATIARRRERRRHAETTSSRERSHDASRVRQTPSGDLSVDRHLPWSMSSSPSASDSAPTSATSSHDTNPTTVSSSARTSPPSSIEPPSAPAQDESRPRAPTAEPPFDDGYRPGVRHVQDSVARRNTPEGRTEWRDDLRRRLLEYGVRESDVPRSLSQDE